MACKSVPSSFPDLPSLTMRRVEVMSKARTLEVWVGALQSILPPKNTRIGELELEHASKNSALEAEAAAVELEST